MSAKNLDEVFQRYSFCRALGRGLRQKVSAVDILPPTATLPDVTAYGSYCTHYGLMGLRPATRIVFRRARKDSAEERSSVMCPAAHGVKARDAAEALEDVLAYHPCICVERFASHSSLPAGSSHHPPPNLCFHPRRSLVFSG